MFLLHKLTQGHRIRTERRSSTHAAIVLVALAKYSPIQKHCKRIGLHIQNMFSLQISTFPMHSPYAQNIRCFQSNNGLQHTNL